VLWGKFKLQEVMGTVSAGDDPCCLDSPQLVLSLLQGRTLRAAQPTLPKVGK